MSPTYELASLRDALRSGDDWEHDLAALFCLQDAPSSSPPPTTARQMRKKQHERKRLRPEIRHLQDVVDDYPRQASQLQGDALVLRHECRAIVKRQKSLREHAQLENRQLRSVVISLAALARQLQAASRRLHYFTGTGGWYEGPTPDPTQLLSRLDALAIDASRVLSPEAFAASRSEDFSNTNYVVCECAVIHVQFAANWLLPFPVDEAAAAVRAQTICDSRADRSVDATNLYADSTTVVSQSASTVSPTQVVQDTDEREWHVGSVHSRIATRRQPTEADGSVVLVSHASSKVIALSGNCLGYLKGDSWVSIERVATSTLSPLTRIKWYRKFDGIPPEHSSPALRTKWLRGIRSKPVALRWEQDLAAFAQAIEDRLLASASRKRRL